MTTELMKAVESATPMCGKDTPDWVEIDEADWDTILAALRDLEAENARLREAMEPRLRELHYDASGLRASLDGGACKALAASFAEQFNSSGAVNYLDVEFTAADGTSFIVTVQKRAKPTAHELRKLAESRLATANALLLRYCVQVGELSKGLDPHDPIFVDLQRLGTDYMAHLQGAGNEH